MAGERTVKRSPDFDRILNLPRREATLAAGEEASDLLTPLLTTALGRRRGARLRPWQALFLQELADNISLWRGGFLGLSVGGGKSLPMFLGAHVVGATRPLVIVPGKLEADTRTKFASYSEDWVQPRPVPYIVTIEQLQGDDYVDFLDRFKPDYIAVDEVHKLKNHARAVTKRIARFQSAYQCRVLGFSGSPYDKMIQDCSHFLTWCLQDGAPVPINMAELNHWGDALNVPNPRVGQRPGVGVLVDLTPGVQGTTALQRGRRAFGRRVCETPGVIIADDTECDAPLTIQFQAAPEDDTLNAAFVDWREDYKLPDGMKANDVFSQLRLEDEMGAGIYQQLIPPPPTEWREARWAVCDLIREQIAKSDRARRPLDTEAAVLKALKDHYIVRDWLAVKPIYDPTKHSVTTWITESVAEFAAEWIDTRRGVVATLNPAVGRRIAELAGVRYYGSQGLAADGTFIENERKGVGAVFSIKANGEGRNLQYHWHEMLMIGSERNAGSLEQTIGRIHRYGQDKHTTVTVLCTSGSTIANFRKARSNAQDFACELTNHVNKILLCPEPRVIYPSDALRWA